ncbi:MAG: response regulator [Bacteroidota bacterium]|nr:response regulator [Bacteroidota bacterium]
MRNGTSPLIFVVDDNPTYNKLVVSYLKSNNFLEVKSFLSGEECIQHINENPDIIIQDYLLEGINGIDVLKGVKKKHPSIEFIFLSGQDNIEVAINTMKFGAFDYIVKDEVALKKMVSKINKIMSIKQLQKSNRYYKTGVILFLIILAITVVTLMSLSYFFPEKFKF